MAAVIQSRPNTCSRSKDNGCKQIGECKEVVYQIVLEESTDVDTDCCAESDESVFSIQGETTVSAKDSSDITTCGSCSGGDDNDDELECSSRGEFDIASSSPQTCPHPWSYDQNVSSESSPYPPKIRRATDNGKLFSDRDLSADESGSYSSEFEFSGSDDVVFSKELRFAYCVMCSSLNRNPSFQFCDSCYQIKKGFFPEKPAAKKKRKISSMSREDARLRKRMKSSPANVIPSVTMSNSVNGILSSSIRNLNYEINVVATNADVNASTATYNRLFEADTELICSSVMDSGFESRMGSSRIECSSSNGCNSNDKCLACLLNPTNALFLHGKTGHRCCCYRCAKRIWFQSRRCPICRSRVANIIRILNV